MMDQASQLKLQAWLDGEMPEAERVEWERRAASDPEAQALVRELTSASKAFRDFGDSLKAPVTREFYWSGIERRINALQNREEAARRPEPQTDWLQWLRRFLVPAGAVAALVIAAWFIAPQLEMQPARRGMRLEAAVSSPGSFTYRDFSSGTTLVWLSYPAESEFADFEAALTLP